MSWRERVRGWWIERHPRSDTHALGQRNVYILPTRAGWMFALTLLVLLVATINFQLSLGYALTFLLAGSALVSMHITHGTLRGLALRLRPPQPVFAGEPALLDIVLSAPAGSRPRYGVGLRAGRTGEWAWVDVPAAGQAMAQLSFVTDRRGLHGLPVLRIETHFPFGLFRAWSVWRPSASVLVYPRPEEPPAALPVPRASAGRPDAGWREGSGDDVDGVRPWRRGDPLRHIVWKKSARALETGAELIGRDTRRAAHQELWLDYQTAGTPAAEERLSRLAAWVLAAERMGADYGLRLPGREIAPAHGPSQRRASLEALALWS